MRFEAMKVGELAKRTGLTIRALHHYDEIGLLRPSLHTGAGHRLYTAADVARLQQVLSLRQLGFSLDEVRACLDRPDVAPLEIIQLHRARLREHIEMQQRLCDRLQAVAAHLQAAETVSTESLLQTIEVMTMIENYYTPEQLGTLKERREQVGEARMQQAPNDWSQLFADFRAEMEKGTDPSDATVRELVRRRQALIDEFTGGDAGITQSLNRLWKEQGQTLAAQHGYDHDPRLIEYMNKATKAQG